MSTELDKAYQPDKVQDAITNLRKMRAQNAIDKEAYDKLHAEERQKEFIPTKLEDITDEQLPEYNEEFVKELGKFDSIEDFEAKLKEDPKDHLARAYLGSACALRAKAGFWGPSKLKYLKRGKKLLDDAVTAERRIEAKALPSLHY